MIGLCSEPWKISLLLTQRGAGGIWGGGAGWPATSGKCLASSRDHTEGTGEESACCPLGESHQDTGFARGSQASSPAEGQKNSGRQSAGGPLGGRWPLALHIGAVAGMNPTSTARPEAGEGAEAQGDRVACLGTHGASQELDSAHPVPRDHTTQAQAGRPCPRHGSSARPMWEASGCWPPTSKRQMRFLFCSVLIAQMFNSGTFAFPGQCLSNRHTQSRPSATAGLCHLRRAHGPRTGHAKIFPL